MKKSETGFARLMEVAGRKRGLLTFGGIFSSLGTAMTMIPFISIYFILAELFNNAANPMASDGPYIIRWGLIALGGLLGGLLFIYIGSMACHIAAFRILYDMRTSLASHIGRLPLGYLTRSATGTIKKMLDLNVEKVENFIAHSLPDLIGASALIVIMMVAMFFFNIWLAIAALVPIFLAFVAQAAMFGKAGRRGWLAKYQDSLEKVSASAVQYVRGMPAIKIFGQTVHSFRQFHKDITDYRDFVVAYSDGFENSYGAFRALLVSLPVFILGGGALLISREPNNLAVALVFLSFIVVVPGLRSPLFKLMHFTAQTKHIDEGLRRVDLIFGQRPTPETTAPRVPESYEVTFKNVVFSYNSDAATRLEALSDVSFTAPQGGVTALVGPSGSGKSTVANLIPRFWDVTEGSISIGGVDVRDIATEQLMDIVSFVFQDSFLFYDTILENIRMSRPSATREEVIAAAKAAQCHDFISELEKGYDTMIGEGGTFVSGGEEQRINVARAILKDTPILVLDEATAFADPDNEHRMQVALSTLMQGKTVIVIAHRLSSVRRANQIIVLEEGHIAQRGTHDDLLAAGGLYSKMWTAFVSSAGWRIRGKEANS